MLTVRERETTSETTLAQRQAAANLASNLAAMRTFGIECAAPPLPDDLELVFARDGTLTAIDTATDRFWNDCSVPTRAAQQQLRKLEAVGSCVCLLAPQHPAWVRETLDRLEPQQALLVLLPGDDDAALLLRCDDFAAEISRGRLWIAFGDGWPAMLRQTLIDRPGLAVPTQFVRTKSVDSTNADEMIAPAQSVFSEVSQRRSLALESLAPWARSGAISRVCAIGRSRFKLWDDGGLEMLRVLSHVGNVEAQQFDTDHPLCATPLALAAAARDADAIVAADVYRADAPSAVAPTDQPWLTWATSPRRLPITNIGPRDWLIASSEEIARAATGAGWPADRMTIAAWPTRPTTSSPPHHGPISFIADVGPLDPPAALNDFSSHRLLWEWIVARTSRDPFAGFDAAEKLVREGQKAIGVTDASLPLGLFTDVLIPRAFAVGIARLLASAKLPIQLFGEGWNNFADLAAFHAGPIRSAAQWLTAIDASTALVDVSSRSTAHPIHAAGRPVLRYRGGGTASFVQDVKRVLGSASSADNATPAPPPLSAATIASLFIRLSGSPSRG